MTDPEHEIARLAAKNGEEVLPGTAVVRNMRVGFSDSRFFREAGVPAVVYGPTHNMGGTDEHVTIDDVFAVLYVHALTAFDYLARR